VKKLSEAMVKHYGKKGFASNKGINESFTKL
jgi:hypothetical protein